MSKLTGPMAAVLVSLILTLGILYGSGALVQPSDTYATVSFDGGYKKIGVISEERIFTKAEVTLEGQTLKTGDFETIINFMTEAATEAGGLEKATLKSGVQVSASAGLKWVGSESNFDLTTDEIKLVSTEEKPLLNKDVVTQLETLKKLAKDNRKKNSEESLEFGPAPKESFLLSKLLSLISK